jgi:prepilin peptidase CpaA
LRNWAAGIQAINQMALTGDWLVAGGWHTIATAILVALLVMAAFVDVRERRIPNVLVFAGMGLALLLAHVPGGSVGSSVVGIAVGVAMGLPMYWLRSMGAGDVKLMGMTGAFLGGADVFGAVIVVFVVGAVLGLVAAARKRALGQLGVNLKQMAAEGLAGTVGQTGPIAEAPYRSVGKLPYAVAIAAGTILYVAVLKGRGIFA